MRTHRIVLAAVSLIAAISLFACAGQQEETKPAPAPVALKATKAKITKATKTGVDSGHPIIEVSGTMPGPGWEPEVKYEKTPEGVKISIIAVPGPGAEKGADTPFTHKFTATGVPSGKAARVFDHRGVQIKRINP